MREHFKIAERFLKSSRTLLCDGDVRSAIDRAYYAMFHAAQAVLAWRGIKPPRTHRGLRKVFGREILLKGLCDKRFGKYLTKGFRMRQVGTYTLGIYFDDEEVEDLIKDAESFVKEMKRIVRL